MSSPLCQGEDRGVTSGAQTSPAPGLEQGVGGLPYPDAGGDTLFVEQAGGTRTGLQALPRGFHEHLLGPGKVIPA